MTNEEIDKLSIDELNDLIIHNEILLSQYKLEISDIELKIIDVKNELKRLNKKKSNMK